MNKTTPFFDGFHIITLNRKHRSAEQVMAEELAVLRQKIYRAYTDEVILFFDLGRSRHVDELRIWPGTLRCRA